MPEHIHYVMPYRDRPGERSSPSSGRCTPMATGLQITQISYVYTPFHFFGENTLNQDSD